MSSSFRAASWGCHLVDAILSMLCGNSLWLWSAGLLICLFVFRLLSSSFSTTTEGTVFVWFKEEREKQRVLWWTLRHLLPPHIPLFAVLRSADFYQNSTHTDAHTKERRKESKNWIVKVGCALKWGGSRAKRDTEGSALRFKKVKRGGKESAPPCRERTKQTKTSKLRTRMTDSSSLRLFHKRREGDRERKREGGGRAWQGPHPSVVFNKPQKRTPAAPHSTTEENTSLQIIEMYKWKMKNGERKGEKANSHNERERERGRCT